MQSEKVQVDLPFVVSLVHFVQDEPSEDREYWEDWTVFCPRKRRAPEHKESNGASGIPFVRDLCYSIASSNTHLCSASQEPPME